MKFLDLTGKRFRHLTVNKQLPDYFTSGGNKVHKWSCSCDCGRDNNVICSTGDLTSGKRWRCTYCVRDDAANRLEKKNKKYNDYDLTGEYGIGYTSSGDKFLFDLDDYEKIKDYCWYKHHNYFEAKILCDDDQKKAVGLHKLIMDDLNNEYDVDHIKTEYKYDNRKLNLRKVNRSQNAYNAKLSKNNTSGVTGVKWHKRDKVWESSIRVNYKNIYLGRSHNFEEAAKLRKEAEKKYFGEYSYDKSQEIYEKATKKGD